jgi:archaellum component FlaC
VIATHTDRGHIHSHILVNTYTLTGRKLNANKTTLDRVKEYSDRVCLAFGIQPYDKSKGKGKTVSHHEWEKRRQGTSWKQKLRAEIDSLIGSVKNLDELLYELELKGYDVKKGKYISLKAPGQQRFIRTKTLGEEYTAENLSSRILWGDFGSGAVLKDEPSPLRECYETVIGQVIVLAAEKKKIPHRISSTEPYSPGNDLDVHRLSAQLTIISRDHIRSIGELEGKIETAKASYEQAMRTLNIMTTEQERLSSLIHQAEIYFDLSGKTDLTDMEQLRLTVSRQSVLNNGIAGRADLDRLRAQMQENEKQIASLKETLRKCQQTYTVYADIAKTYREISQGDYIFKLVEEERKRQAAEKSRRKKNASL